MLDCTLSLGLQKVTLEAGFLTPCVWLFRRCPRTRLWVLDCTLSLGLQKVTLEVVFLTLFGCLTVHSGRGFGCLTVHCL